MLALLLEPALVLELEMWHGVHRHAHEGTSHARPVVVIITCSMASSC